MKFLPSTSLYRALFYRIPSMSNRIFACRFAGGGPDPELMKIHNKLPKNYKSFAGQMTIDNPAFYYDRVMKVPRDPNLKYEDIPAWSYRQTFVMNPLGTWRGQYRSWIFLSTVFWGWLIWRMYWGGYNMLLGEPEFTVAPDPSSFTDEELGIPSDDTVPPRGLDSVYFDDRFMFSHLAYHKWYWVVQFQTFDLFTLDRIIMTVLAKIGIIGGTGLDDADILHGASEKYVDTPFGKPSDALKIGKLDGMPCVLLSRHGRKHTISPSMINYRANMWALKHEGCTHVLVSTACGSLQERIKPGDIVILDQFIDRTTQRASTFFDCTPGGPIGVCHIPMDEPFCQDTRKILLETARELGIPFHPTGTTVCIEGGRFSSKAESRLFRKWDADVVNMTTVPEACLAKELGMSYASIAMATDYDCWHENVEPVSVDAVMECFHQNSQKACNIIRLALKKIQAKDWTDTISKNKKIARAAVMLPTGCPNEDSYFPYL